MIEQKRVTGGEICLPFWFAPQQKTPSFMWRGLERYGGMLLAYSSDVLEKKAHSAPSHKANDFSHGALLVMLR